MTKQELIEKWAEELYKVDHPSEYYKWSESSVKGNYLYRAEHDVEWFLSQGLGVAGDLTNPPSKYGKVNVIEYADGYDDCMADMSELNKAWKPLE